MKNPSYRIIPHQRGSNEIPDPQRPFEVRQDGRMNSKWYATRLQAENSIPNVKEEKKNES